jgi:hypothetical protein
VKILDKHKPEKFWFNSLKPLKLLAFLRHKIAISLFCIFLGLGCQSPLIANSQNSPPPAPAVYICRSQIAPYGKTAFEVEFDFIDRQFQHLLVATKRQRPDQKPEEIIVWDALYGTDGDYDYWTTPILREFTIEKDQPLVITRKQSLPRYPNTIAKLNATLSVDFRRKTFPVSCTENSPASNTVTMAQVHTCRAKVSPSKLPLFDVEFDLLTESSLVKRYGYSAQNIYVKATALFESSKGQVRYLEALVGSDGDYTFWTTPVLRDIAGGISPFVISREPGILVRPGSPSLITQLNSAVTLDFASKSYPVKCS